MEFQWFKPKIVRVILPRDDWHNRGSFLTAFEGDNVLKYRSAFQPLEGGELKYLVEGGLYRFGKDHESLYLDFSNLPITPPPFTYRDCQPYESFANSYGLLGSDLLELVEFEGGKIHSESVYNWMAEVVQMKRALRWFEAIRNKDLDFLKRGVYWERFKYEKDSPYSLRAGLDISFIEPALYNFQNSRWGDAWPQLCVTQTLHIAGLPTDEDVFNAAERFLHLWINRGVWERTSVELWRYPDGVKVDSFPLFLIGALWMQLAYRVTKVKAMRRCEGCFEPFTIKDKLNARIDKKYHSAACKQKAYRRKLREKRL